MSAGPSIERRRRIAVIGGGISGLAAAHRLVELDPRLELTLFEASDRLGGVLQTERRDGYLIERSADNFITNVPWAIDLCRRLGLSDDLLPTRAADRRAFVVRRGRLYPVPEGFTLMAPTRIAPLVTTPLLSVRGKLRLLAEALVPRRPDAGTDESLASFVTRRFGRETFQRLVQPLVGGIYTADAEQLSLAATLPRFLEMEREHGSLIRAMLRQRKSRSASGAGESGARYSLFTAPREGMSMLIDALVARLPAATARCNTPVAELGLVEGRWSIAGAVELFDAVILATPAPVAARQLAAVAPELSTELAQIAYAGSAVVVLGYRQEQFARPLAGFGFVVPEIERRDILAVSYSSQKYEGRAPEGRALLRVFIGGATRPELIDRPDHELQRIAERELGELLGVRGAPELVEVVRWHGAMPQYHLGHIERLARIQRLAAALPGLALAGNAYQGVGIPHCVHSGEAAAERMARW
ncbi:MAG TPA: protoporphyrinogen oxidase [Pirellulales bacterium]|nr:protoporphyrinogen oxidase [Pirellulales bacterium]